ncbi:site-specific DNA-methyltransferase [Pedobacter sp. Leaf41]|uniref:DNA-methyltransferase n=1 Tax=Pedobacter sp. Leaf41 TaxID=1736218 RepID=UPI000AD9E02C|nr:site-specific DNA-methyltransferase [Pedobacter sp. Leaf41]
MESVILGDCTESLKKLESSTVDLVIADPPYWNVVNEKWDRQWRTEHDYVKWSLEWISEISRVLRLGGSFYLFGYFRTLAHLVPHFESLGLDVRQQIIVDKGMRSVSGRATKNYRLFPNVTESILFITKDNKQFIKPYLKEHQALQGLSSKQINEGLGVKSNGGGMWSIYTGKNICEQFPTKELWEKLKSILKFDLEYKDIAQTFNAQMGITDVWRDIDFYRETRVHPTQKPLTLISRLIAASSNENNLVLDPFGGSGSTAIAALQMNRRFITIESDLNYYNEIINRIDVVKNPLGSQLTSSSMVF